MLNKRGNLVYFRRAQVTIFIIIAIIIVALALLLYMFFPKIQENLGLVAVSPMGFIQDCLEQDIETSVEAISLQGGSLEPEHYVLYDNSQVEYLCYTEEYYAPCVMQKPMLKNHIESEIQRAIKVKTKECFDSMKTSYEKRGYDVELIQGETYVELLPKRIVVTIDADVSLKKESTEKYENFRVVLNNNLYELVIIATSILNWEARYGDAETTVYMDYYPELKVEKKLQTDGTNIYILTERDTGNKFQFASRSMPFPPGYGIEV